MVGIRVIVILAVLKEERESGVVLKPMVLRVAKEVVRIESEMVGENIFHCDLLDLGKDQTSRKTTGRIDLLQ